MLFSHGNDPQLIIYIFTARKMVEIQYPHRREVFTSYSTEST